MRRERAASERPATPIRARRTFKRRELRLSDGGSLVLTTGGSIDQLAADGTTTRSWAPDDADWPRQALRFGVRPQGATVTPASRPDGALRAPQR